MKEREKNPKTVLPSDLVEDEILQRLPVKSLLRFKSVSKKWRWTIESTRFVMKHMGCPFSNPKLVVVGAKTTRGGDENLLTFILETFSRDDQSEVNRFTCSCTFPDPIRLVRLFYKVVGSCDGLICIKDRRDGRLSTDYKTTVYIINPTTRKHRIFHSEQLHQARDSISYIGFGKDMVTGTYKMILLSGNIDDSDANNKPLKTSVLTLDNGSRRRDIGFFPVSRNKISYLHAPVVFANGSVIWFTGPSYLRSSSDKKTPIDFVALDLHTEKFRRIMWPSWYVEHRPSMRLWSLKNRLCLSDVKQFPDVDVWSLDSFEKWEKIFSINVSSIGRLDTHFWMVCLEAAYFKPTIYLWSEAEEEEEETHVDHQFPRFTRWKTTLYTERA